MPWRNLLTTRPDPPQQQLYVNTLIRTSQSNSLSLRTLPKNNFFSHLFLPKIFHPKSFITSTKSKCTVSSLSPSSPSAQAHPSSVRTRSAQCTFAAHSSLQERSTRASLPLTDKNVSLLIPRPFPPFPVLSSHQPTHRKAAANAPSRPRSNRQKRQSDQEMELQLSIAHGWSRRFASRRGITHTAAIDCLLLPYQCEIPSSFLFNLFPRYFSFSAFLPLHLYTSDSSYSIRTTVTDIAQIPGLTTNYGHDCLSVSDAASGETEGADADSSDAKRAVGVADSTDENTDEISGYDLFDSNDERPVHFDKRPVHSQGH